MWLSWLNAPVYSQELPKAGWREGLYSVLGEKGGFWFTDSLLYGTSKHPFSKVWQRWSSHRNYFPDESELWSGKGKHIQWVVAVQFNLPVYPNCRCSLPVQIIRSYWSLLSLSTEKHTWSAELQQISWVLTIAIRNLGGGDWFGLFFF